MNNARTNLRIAIGVASAGVILAQLRLPFGYYQLLRLYFTALALFILMKVDSGQSGHRLVLGAVAVLYNPIVPVALGNKTLWTVVNVATVAYFWFLQRKEFVRS